MDNCQQILPDTPLKLRIFASKCFVLEEAGCRILLSVFRWASLMKRRSHHVHDSNSFSGSCFFCRVIGVITLACGVSSDCSPCRRVVRGNACSGNTAAHTAPLPAAALRQCLIGTFLHRQRLSDVPCFCAPCRFPCFPVAAQWAQRKPPSGSVSMEHSWGKSPQKLLQRITGEAGKVGDYGSYSRLTYSASAPAHTPA